MRILGLVAALALVTGCVTGPAKPSPELALALKRSTAKDTNDAGVVAIFIVAPSGRLNFCNGVAVTPSRVLTAAHCCVEGDTYVGGADVVPKDVIMKDGKDFEARLAAKLTKVTWCHQREKVGRWSGTVTKVDDIYGDVGLMELAAPLPGVVKSQERLAKDAIVKAAPPLVIGLDANLREYHHRAPSPAVVEIIQLLPPERIENATLAPLRVSDRVIGFGVEVGIIVLAQVGTETIAGGTSGSPVYVVEGGRRRLLGLISSTSVYGDTALPIATDLRTHADWIDDLFRIK